MRPIRLILVLLLGLSAWSLPAAQAELIWGEIQSVRDNGNMMVIRSYDTYSGEVRDFTVAAPEAGNAEDEKSLRALDIGDEVIVDASPEEGSNRWQASFMNLPSA